MLALYRVGRHPTAGGNFGCRLGNLASEFTNFFGRDNGPDEYGFSVRAPQPCAASDADDVLRRRRDCHSASHAAPRSPSQIGVRST